MKKTSTIIPKIENNTKKTITPNNKKRNDPKQHENSVSRKPPTTPEAKLFTLVSLATQHQSLDNTTQKNPEYKKKENHSKSPVPHPSNQTGRQLAPPQIQIKKISEAKKPEPPKDSEDPPHSNTHMSFLNYTKMNRICTKKKKKIIHW